ncbi:hypothetical protein Tco_0620201 [Tanacetum coccineum]
MLYLCGYIKWAQRVINESVKFTSVDRETDESYYLRFTKIINELNRNKLNKMRIDENIKFLLNLLPEWKRYVNIGADRWNGNSTPIPLMDPRRRRVQMGVETGVHRVHDEKHVWFEVELQGAQGDREAEVFQVSNDDTAVAQRWLEDKQPKKKTNMDCLVKEQEKEYQTGWKIKTGNVLDS